MRDNTIGLDPEDYERQRRKTLEDAQNAFANRSSDRAWMLVVCRSPRDFAGSYNKSFWQPSEGNSYETMAQQAERFQKMTAESCRKAICKYCAGNVTTEWGGFAPGGSHSWLHTIPVEDEPPLRTRLLEKWLNLEICERPTHLEIVACEASPIIQRYNLIEVPPLPGAGVNTGAYPGAAKPYNDPSVP
jgi:hypothetical protein